MADGIRLDLRRALAEGPSAIPNLEPLFAPDAILRMLSGENSILQE